jgi:hypothetical protein
MRFAYADPPYIGYAKSFYGDPTYDSLDAHRDLVARLVADFPDGWVMSLYSNALKIILPLCPSDVRIGAWVKPFAPFRPGINPGYLWEPVIFRGGRKRRRTERTVRDWVSSSSALKKGFRGAKPEAFAFWVFALMGASPDDEFVDLFPGSGAIGRAWEVWQSRQGGLDSPDYSQPLTKARSR